MNWLIAPGRFARTLRHVPATQVAHRLRLRARRAWYRWRPDGLPAAWADGVPATGRWPDGFRPIDLSVQHQVPTQSGVIAMVGESHNVLTDGWRPQERTQLYRYHLHYFEWAWPLAVSQDRRLFSQMWVSWRDDTQPGRWDEWSPYVVALRAWVLCGVFDDLVTGSDVQAEVTDHLRACLGFLERNLELDVCGNHLIKDLKAIVGLALFFDQPHRAEAAMTRLVSQIDHQIQADGGHFELSPSYHAQVLVDLIDIRALWEAAGLGTAREVGAAIMRMADWLAVMTYPDGTLPLIGDCTPPPAGLLEELRSRVAGAVPKLLEVLTDTGYVAVRPRPGVMAVFDFGQPCPPELPSHAQADWGTFELWIDGRHGAESRIVVDPGVSTYVGERRKWERSTAAHNTVCVDQTDQTEVWGSFRTGRRPRPGPIVASERDGVVIIEAELAGLPGSVTHRRTVKVYHDALRIYDAISPDVSAESALNVADKGLAQQIKGSGPIDLSPVQVAAGFGHTTGAVRLTQPVMAGRAEWTVPIGGSDT